MSASTDIRRRELADFLRSRRERITPEQVGLPRGARRRTPGLRREEVAQLSAVGVTWYTWLEQARDIQVSAQVLDAVARTLMLDPTERAHLFVLAGLPDPVPGSDCPYLTPSLLEVLDQLEPLPACVMNSRYDILAYNRSYGWLVEDLDALPPEERNILWLVFTDPDWREAVIDRDQVIRRCTAQFRAAMAEHVAEPVWKLQVKRLQQASEEFREVWSEHEVVRPSSTTKRFLNKRFGLLNMVHSSMWLGQRSGSRMVVYTPLDEETRERLDRLQAFALAQEDARRRTLRQEAEPGADRRPVAV
ncbi:helix-turn-helix transcriptional regulator [Streptomyces sp. PTM05]|uniref:Helix-turn-helix transcriptional regulator n=1 Tax=Streptantibioticus parmotrematis TaxID=2873249 RepID=A0ABS7QXC6_9ACTN|nr:helix-turn-helix transcriptional regulator [Streptantibioticus parmotrematis]MBY8887861.1 helix-turn-helix transcriptional regulator [Streptantibioticus parmotrematis]